MKAVIEDDFWKGRTVVFSTNNLGMLRFVDRVIFIQDFEIIHFCSPTEIKNTPEYGEISLKKEEEKIEVIFLLKNRKILKFKKN